MNEQQTNELTQTSPELIEALAATLGPILGQERLQVEALHTGGGCMVAAIDLSIDGRFHGRQVWLTREGPNEWLLGFYDFYMDEEDEGLCVAIRGTRTPESFRRGEFDDNDPADFTSNSPYWLAAQVGGIFERLGVTSLQGA